MLGVAGDALGRLMGGKEVGGEVPFKQGRLAGAFEGMGSWGKNKEKKRRSIPIR